MTTLQDIHRLLTQARRLIAAANPKEGSVLDGVDELVHAALMVAEKKTAETEKENAND